MRRQCTQPRLLLDFGERHQEQRSRRGGVGGGGVDCESPPAGTYVPPPPPESCMTLAVTPVDVRCSVGPWTNHRETIVVLCPSARPVLVALRHVVSTTCPAEKLGCIVQAPLAKTHLCETHSSRLHRPLFLHILVLPSLPHRRLPRRDRYQHPKPPAPPTTRGLSPAMMN